MDGRLMENLILAVDDDQLALILMEETLGEKYEVVLANSGEEALEKFEEHKPALILLDIMMPDLDGYEVLRRIKATPGGKSTQVILVSAKDTTKDRLEGYDAGADGYVVKPFEPEKLLDIVRIQMMAQKLSRRTQE